jgi:hypothetical protein
MSTDQSESEVQFPTHRIVDNAITQALHLAAKYGFQDRSWLPSGRGYRTFPYCTRKCKWTRVAIIHNIFQVMRWNTHTHIHIYICWWTVWFTARMRHKRDPSNLICCSLPLLTQFCCLQLCWTVFAAPRFISVVTMCRASTVCAEQTQGRQHFNSSALLMPELFFYHAFSSVEQRPKAIYEL